MIACFRIASASISTNLFFFFSQSAQRLEGKFTIKNWILIWPCNISKSVFVFLYVLLYHSFFFKNKSIYLHNIYISIFKIPLPLYIYFGRFSLFIVGIFGLAPFSVYELENGLKISIILFSVLFNFAIFGQHKILPINEIQSKLIVIQFVIVYVVVGEQ